MKRNLKSMQASRDRVLSKMSDEQKPRLMQPTDRMLMCIILRRNRKTYYPDDF